MKYRFAQFALVASFVAIMACFTTLSWSAQPFVPGTGDFLEDCSDDFEDETWSYTYRHPKSSHEQDENQRPPGGRSSNGLWHEGAKRGTPDLVKRVPTPAGGIDSSMGALLMSTRLSGIPGKTSNKQQQDDLLMKFDRRLGRSIPVAWQPSCTVRVFLPSFSEWERRPGPSFGMRADCIGRNPDGENEPYWPGMFFLFRPKNSKTKFDSAKLTVRAGARGNDIRSHDITESGWWTLGMSFTPDGQIHYYASPGVDELSEDDYLMSSYPYNFRCVTFNNFFFNVANWDNGRSWSTEWVIDDPQVFVIPPDGQTTANLYRKRATRQTAGSQQRSRSSMSNSMPSTHRPGNRGNR